jgi:multidrug efflux pump subunit AcrB
VRTADDVVYVTDAVQVVQRNLAIGAVLAVLVLFCSCARCRRR